MTVNEWKTDAEAVQSLGEELGWGHLMELAAALWVLECEEDGGSDAGCFVPVPIRFVSDKNKMEAYYQRERYVRAILSAKDEI